MDNCFPFHPQVNSSKTQYMHHIRSMGLRTHLQGWPTWTCFLVLIFTAYQPVSLISSHSCSLRSRSSRKCLHMAFFFYQIMLSGLLRLRHFGSRQGPNKVTLCIWLICLFSSLWSTGSMCSHFFSLAIIWLQQNNLMGGVYHILEYADLSCYCVVYHVTLFPIFPCKLVVRSKSLIRFRLIFW